MRADRLGRAPPLVRRAARAPRGAPPPGPRRRTGRPSSAQRAELFRRRRRSPRGRATPSRSLTSGASFATRFSPSKIALTNSTSYSLYAATERGEVVGDLEHDRQPAVPAEPLVDAARRVARSRRVRRVLRDVLPRRIEQREHPDPAVRLRMALEEQLERLEAADDVLRRIGAVDAEDQSARGGSARAPACRASTVVAPGELVELGACRPRSGARCTRGQRRPLAERCAGDRVEEVLAPAVRVEADDVVRQQALVERARPIGSAAGSRPPASARGCGRSARASPRASRRERTPARDRGGSRGTRPACPASSSSSSSTASATFAFTRP